MIHRTKIICGFWLIGMTVVLLLFHPAVKAATFLPEDGSRGKPATTGIVDTVPPGDDVIFIDDMAFRKSDVQRSGFSGPRWTNGIVYYEFESGLTTQQKNAWLNAAAEWSAVAALSFVPRTYQSNYIYVFSGSGNWSYVGMIGGRQEMSIANWSIKFIIVHEIGHALGMIHEHQRTGRDGYVTIHYANVQSGYGNNFTQWTSTNYGAYDFDSIMHYDKCAFSIDCPAGSTCNCSNLTISVLPPNQHWTDLIGQRNHLSDLDKSGMATRYGNTENTPTPTPEPHPTNTPIATHTPLPTATPSPRPTNTPIPTYTPAGTQTQIPTRTPTPTQPPVPTSTPHPGDTRTPTPTATADPQATNTPVQTPTGSPCTDTGVDIDMPAHVFHAGDPCHLKIWMCNATSVPLNDIPLFVILDVFGEIYFAPSWQSNLDSYILTISPGESILVVLPEFLWPSIGGSTTGLVFLAAMTDPAMTRILGEFDQWEFGWE